ncbi:MAG TPA: hypothetical protein VK689_10995, partial [Armatimonadota bacterium]|nr:hypothetical protein [Armatimonadota bacterium]
IRRSEFARLTAVAGKRRFVPCAGCLPSAGIREHLRGGESVAGYLLLESGGTRLLAMDLDPAETPRGSAVPLPSAVADLCRRLRDTCRAAGVPHLAVDSGGGGRHLWVRFSREVSPEDARRLGRLLAYRAGWPEAGARLEVFPRHTEWPGASLGEALPLPGGLHPVTGQPRTALDEQDRPLRLEDALRQFGEVEAESVPRLLEALAGGPPPADAGGAGIRPRRRKTTRARETAGPVEALRQGCTVIRAIEERASGTGHLRHVHNLILLYTAGRLGSEGAAYLHRVIGSTRNYRPEVCQSYIDQLDPDRQPITCARIREWLDEEGESHLCRCPRNRRTPLTVLNNTPSAPRLSTEDEPEAGLRGRPRAPAVMAKPPAAEQWTDVYSDRFDAGESPAELPVADSPGSTSEPETGDGDD